MTTRSVPIRGGSIEIATLSGGGGVPLLVLGGVETGLRRLAGTESVLERRWALRRAARTVRVVGRPLPDDPADAERLMHPSVMADAVASVLSAERIGPVAIEAESGGGRISLWLAVDHPDLVERLILAAAASETPPDGPMAERLGSWIAMAEEGRWAEFFTRMAQVMRPSSGDGDAGAFDATARMQPKPTTPERFIGELRATLDPSSFVTDRLGEIAVPALVLAGGGDQVVPVERSRQVAASIGGARFELDPACGHTVRSSFHGYDQIVEAFLAEGDR